MKFWELPWDSFETLEDLFFESLWLCRVEASSIVVEEEGIEERTLFCVDVKLTDFKSAGLRGVFGCCGGSVVVFWRRSLGDLRGVVDSPLWMKEFLLGISTNTCWGLEEGASRGKPMNSNFEYSISDLGLLTRTDDTKHVFGLRPNL